MVKEPSVRCVGLYRVSTMRQANRKTEDEETIPMQRNAIRAFVASHPGWKLVDEFAEEGISAFKNSSASRDILQNVLLAAKRHSFDVLLVFKADRLSRQSFEYPIILSAFKKEGVTVISVKDEVGGKELTVEGQYDKLLRFIEGWQAETESFNTSIRVSEKMQQLAQQGRWTGGKSPYGYRFDKGNNAVVPLSIQPDEAYVLQKAFDLYLDHNVGTPTITHRLNQEGFLQRNGKPWAENSLRRIMQNPILTGRLAYGKTRQNTGKSRTRLRAHNFDGVILSQIYDHLIVIPLERWNAAMQKMQSYNPPKDKSISSAPRHTRADSSPLLFTGMARCGHCGGPLVSFTVNSHYKTSDGKVRYGRKVYMCQRKATQGNHLCDGQRTYSAKKVETALLAAINETLSHIDTEKIIAAAREQAERNLWSKTTRGKLLKKQIRDALKVRDAWLQRLDRFFTDPEHSMYSEDVLALKAEEANKRVAKLETEMHQIEEEENDLSIQKQSLEQFLANTANWWSSFLTVPRSEQKNLLGKVLDKVVIGRSGYAIHYRVTIEALAGSTTGAVRWQESSTWRQAQ